MTVRINKQKINLREKLAGVEDKVNFDEVVRGLGENTAPLILNKDGGNVGIGAPEPTGKLHIFDASTGNNELSAIVLSNYDYGEGETGQSISIEGRVRNNGGGDNGVAKIVFGKDSDFSSIDKRDGNISFHTMLGVGDTASFNERMRINSAGNVGIGTTDPSRLLTLSSTGATLFSLVSTNDDNCQLLFGDSVSDTVGKIVYRHSSDSMAFETYAEERMRIDSEGNVGIGTTDPSELLEVHSETANAAIEISAGKQNETTGESKLVLRSLYSGSGTVYSRSEIASLAVAGGDSDLIFRTTTNSTGPEERMRIDSEGNVGIGTTDPVGKLHVTDLSVSIGNVDVTDNGADVSGGTSLNTKISDGDRIKINGEIFTVSNVNETTLILSGTPSAAGTFPAYTDSNGLVVTSAGNVGIGTANPGEKLNIEGSSPSIKIKATNQSGQAEIKLQSDNGDSDEDLWSIRAANIQPQNDHLLQFMSYSSGSFVSALAINSNSNVGIGTTDTGSYKLHVYGDVAVNGVSVHSSDDRVKHNEQPIVGALETLSKITPKKYIKTTEMYDANHDFELDADGNPIDSNGEPVEHRIEAGVIAQQVLTIDELAFAVSPEGVDEDGTVTSPHGLDYNSLFTYAIAAIQEQQQLINDLKSRIETLEQQ